MTTFGSMPSTFHPMVLIPGRRYGWAQVRPEQIEEIICHRLKENKVEEYLVKWVGDWSPSRQPYSWHTVHELSGDQTGEPNSLHILQDYVDSRRANKERSISNLKRNSPDDDNHLYPHSAVHNHASDSAHSSPVSDLSRDSVTSTEEPDCYNCKLQVRNEMITARPCHDNLIDTTTFPTRSMMVRAAKTPTDQADEAIRDEFDRRLAKIRGPKPIKHVNERDRLTPSLRFRFVDHYVYGTGVARPDPTSLIGCTSCRPNMGGFCGCEYTKRCECLEYARVDEQSLTESERNLYEKLKEQGGSTMGFPKKFPYTKETGLMVKFYLESRFPIYECNDRCGCGPICKTKVVQRGRKVGLEIFKTKDKGWGLRCSENLERGQFIDIYRGEVITTKEADRREEAAGKNKESYLFSLDKFKDVVNECPYVVDGEYIGGATRFINHSCQPNCVQYAVCYDKNNPYIYDIAIFAIVDIPREEELTFDYLDVDFGNEESKENLEMRLAQDIEEDSVPCKCGAKNCRGWLWK